MSSSSGSRFAHITPPAHADATQKIANENTNQPIGGPIPRDPRMTSIMSHKGYLVPPKAQEDGGEQMLKGGWDSCGGSLTQPQEVPYTTFKRAIERTRDEEDGEEDSVS